MMITVIVCTHNRCNVLSKALQSVSESRLPSSVTWEVLVVDNGSSDNTGSVVEEFKNRYPDRFRYLFEPRIGKSFALNTGIRESRGRILSFLDDDVVVEHTWLQNLTSMLEEGGFAGAGGRTRPILGVPVPRWLALSGPYSLAGILAAVFDFGDEPCQLKDAPYGANMAYRKSMFEKYGDFRTDLGPSSDSQIPRPNEDTEFGRRLMEHGEILRYAPDAIAYHPIAPQRLNQKYFLDWWFDYGRAGVREARWKPDFFGIRRQYLRILKLIITRLVPAFVKWTVAVDPQQRFYMKCQVWTFFGQMVELRRDVKRAVQKGR
jgi:glycosyltransferase involved in cell wall biosynthesis